MGAIFSEAIEVLVWLGKGTDDTEKAVEVAACSAKRVKTAIETIFDLQAFQNIVSNQYWSRLWIIQEFVLARKVVIMSGSKQVSGALFRELARDVAQSDNSLAIARIWPFMTARRRLTAAHMQQRMAYGPSLQGNSPFFDPSLQYTWQDVMRLAKRHASNIHQPTSTQLPGHTPLKGLPSLPRANQKLIFTYSGPPTRAK